MKTKINKLLKMFLYLKYKLFHFYLAANIRKQKRKRNSMKVRVYFLRILKMRYLIEGS